uniref:Reverse transcriptase Ty1/copia-type domain-containing protein n=1 Tax=Tanacetum cinerariifolium TaxID=118510 RepID=A0A6L2J8V8_TANCI|nr:hypothetical protein [Tanacetum cinerariifolium]
MSDTRVIENILRSLPQALIIFLWPWRSQKTSGGKNPWSKLYTQRSLLKKEKRPFYMERTKYEDAVLFEVVVVSKAGNDEEEEKMLTRKMRTIGLNIKEVVGEAFNLKEEVEDEDELTLLMARHDEQKERMEPWHIDSAASNHMTGEEDLFVEMEIVKGMVHGLDQIDHSTQVCEGCILGKHDRTLFLKEATSRAEEPLQLIHTDLCGLVTLPSHEETSESGEEVQQPQSPTPTPNPTSIQDFPSSSSEGEPKKSSLREIYEGYVVKGKEGNSQSMIDELKMSMMREFEMTTIELMSYYLSIEVKQTEEGLFICQERYAKEILNKFNMHDRIVSRFMEEPTTKHLKIVKRILHYIKGTVDYGMFYSTSEEFKLVGYNDSDWAGNKENERSASGFLFFLGQNTKPYKVLIISETQGAPRRAVFSLASGITLNVIDQSSLPSSRVLESSQQRNRLIPFSLAKDI